MPYKILLVDDEKGIRNVLEITLQDAGFDVSQADSGDTAVKLMATQSFDIVLTDIRMPGMDGIDLLKKIKTQTPDTEVIMLTGHGDFELAIESLKLDAVDFISKPINNDVLEIALKRAQDRIVSRNKIKDYTLNLETLVKEKTSELEQSQKKYLQLFNESPGYLTVQDKNLNIVEYNRRFQSDFDYSDGMTCYEVYKQRRSPCPDCPVEKTFNDGKTHTQEMAVVLKDGTEKNILIQTSAIHDSNGDITHVLEMSTDVTMIRTLQDHLVSLGLHISSISHGLKQLITGLDGGAYLIESGLKKQNTPQISDGWEIVKDKITQTRQMVMNILFHSKKRKPERTDVLLNDLINEAVSTIQLKLDQEDINVNIDLPKAPIHLQVDKMAILAVFRSLLENSVDACTNTYRKGRIHIQATEQNHQIQLKLRDNGKGLSPDKKNKIFDLFYSDKGNKGTGLGLFIAKRSIEQHKGEIQVASKKDKYTEFTIILPVKGVEKK
jgi:PAS domain S-box-containing protein